MNQPVLLLATSLSLLLGTVTRASEPSAVAAKMREFVDKKEVAGTVTAVVTKGDVKVEAVGLADVERGTPMRPDTLFWIASMTKPVTGVAVAMMHEEGKLSIDDPVAKYIPEFSGLKTADGKAATVTIKHLLTHTSGLAEATPELSRTAKTLADLIPHFAKQPLKFQPGSKWEYCQSSINTAARVVEIVSGESFPDFLQKRLFAPLGMKDTTFYPSRDQLTRLAKSYRKDGDKLAEAKIFMLEGKDPTSRDRYPAANGGLFSTAPDYARFCRMLLNDGTLDGRQYLKPETVALLSKIHSGEVTTGFTPGNGWGLGFCVVRQPQGVSEKLSPGSFGHGGAYGTQAWIDPKKGIAYVLMTQRANFPNSDASDVRKAFQEAASAAN
jgi:CubicO group peptidase (beta-lactamase class C family)